MTQKARAEKPAGGGTHMRRILQHRFIGRLALAAGVVLVLLAMAFAWMRSG